MMESVWFRLLMGHIMGDYMLQTRDMAYEKQKLTVAGSWWLTAHGFVYTACVSLWLLPECIAFPWLVPMLLLSHMPIDGFPIAAWWLHKLGRRGPCEATLPGEAAISAVVYCVIDNGMHLMLMGAALAISQIGR